MSDRNDYKKLCGELDLMIRGLKLDLMVERERAERAKAELASLADTIAAAHRNTEMHGEGVERDLREAVWQLSYRANGYRAERDAVMALSAQADRHRDELLAENDVLRALLLEGKALVAACGNQGLVDRIDAAIDNSRTP